MVQTHSKVTFAKWAKPYLLKKKWNFHLRLPSERIVFYFLPVFKHVIEPNQGPSAMNTRKEPLHDTVCVVHVEPPHNGDGDVASFNFKKNWRQQI